jgi:hypothetical protein
MHCAHAIEFGTTPELIGRNTIHGENIYERRVLALRGSRACFAGDFVASAEAVTLDELVADVNVTVAGEVAGFAAAYKAGPAPHYIEDAKRFFAVQNCLSLWL